jgi:hypothetical protein
MDSGQGQKGEAEQKKTEIKKGLLLTSVISD